MTLTPRLAVVDPQGRRTVPVEKPLFKIGRRATADLQIAGAEVSREHAEIVLEGGVCRLRDCGSRFGTFVNDQAITAPHELIHGDRIRLGRVREVELTFLSDATSLTSLPSATDVSDLRQMAAILDGLRAIGSGRVLDEVLTLVLDSALGVTTAERGGIMLPSAKGELELKVARGRHRTALVGPDFTISEKIPREVFATGQSRIVADLLDESWADAHGATVAIGIRHVLCVPLQIAAYAAGAVSPAIPRIIGVLYLDGRERGTLLSPQTRSSLEAFATQAALAIDSARLYVEAAEKAKLDRDLRVAAEIQQALLPELTFSGPTYDLAAASRPCRTIGGDFFDYLDVSDGRFGFALGDVAGKGPPAALLAATVQSNFVAHAPVAAHPAETMARINAALLRRAIAARFATMFYGALSPDGHLDYCNAGQEPPIVVRAGGVTETLETGGPVIGLLGIATYEPGTLQLAPGDLVIICSDGVTEARNAADDEYGAERLTNVLVNRHGAHPEHVLDAMLTSVNEFVGFAPQADDITALVLRYRGQ